MDYNIAMVFEALAVTFLEYVKFSSSYLYESCFSHVIEGRTQPHQRWQIRPVYITFNAPQSSQRKQGRRISLRRRLRHLAYSRWKGASAAVPLWLTPQPSVITQARALQHHQSEDDCAKDDRS